MAGYRSERRVTIKDYAEIIICHGVEAVVDRSVGFSFSVGGMIHSKPFSHKNLCRYSVEVPAVGIFMGGAPTPNGKS
jgi:hypothetical protein